MRGTWSPERRHRDVIVAEMMRILHPLFEQLPLGVREAAESVVETPECFFDADDVARRARLSRRHLDRVFQRAQFASAKQLVIACRAYTAIRLLASSAPGIDTAAKVVGYDGERGLRRHSDAIWHTGPRAAATMPMEILQEKLVDFICNTMSDGPPDGEASRY